MKSLRLTQDFVINKLCSHKYNYTNKRLATLNMTVNMKTKTNETFAFNKRLYFQKAFPSNYCFTFKHFSVISKMAHDKMACIYFNCKYTLNCC